MSDLINSFEFTRHGHKFIARVYFDSDMGAPWEESDGHGPVSERRDPETKRPGERPLGESDRQGYVRLYDWQEAIAMAKRDGWGWLPGELTTKQIGTVWEAKCPGFVALGGDINEAIRNLYASHKASMTPGQYAAGAVQKDFDRLDGWARDLWHWVGISVSPMQASRATLLDALESVLDSDTLESAHDAARLAINAADEYAPENYSNALWGIESDNPEYHSQVAQELADQIIAAMES